MSIDDHSKRLKIEDKQRLHSKNMKTVKQMEGSHNNRLLFKEAGSYIEKYLKDLIVLLSTIKPVKSPKFKAAEKQPIHNPELKNLLTLIGYHPYGTSSWRRLRSKIERALSNFDKNMSESGRREVAEDSFKDVLNEIRNHVILSRDPAEAVTICEKIELIQSKS